MRSDAVATRERVLASAREVCGQLAPPASLDAISRHAGVGSATVYRHFKGRNELLKTVFSQRLVAVEEYLEALGTVEDA